MLSDNVLRVRSWLGLFKEIVISEEKSEFPNSLSGFILEYPKAYLLLKIFHNHI